MILVWYVVMIDDVSRDLLRTIFFLYKAQSIKFLILLSIDVLTVITQYALMEPDIEYGQIGTVCGCIVIPMSGSIDQLGLIVGI